MSFMTRWEDERAELLAHLIDEGVLMEHNPNDPFCDCPECTKGLEEAGLLQTSEGTYHFYKDDRDRIKSASMLPTETLRYIEALEQIARAGIEVWKNTPHANKPTQLTRDALNELYDKLMTVNFLDESL